MTRTAGTTAKSSCCGIGGAASDHPRQRDQYRRRGSEPGRTTARRGIQNCAQRGLEPIWTKQMSDGKIIKLVDSALADNPFTEDALALRFSERHKDDLRYIATKGQWQKWD